MHGGRGVCQWCARSSPVETRQNPRPRTTTTVTVNSNGNRSNVIDEKNNNNNDGDDDDDTGRSVSGGCKNPVSIKNNNKYISDVVINGSIRRAGTVARQRRRQRQQQQQHCYRAVSSTLFRRCVGVSRRFSRDAVAGYG